MVKVKVATPGEHDYEKSAVLFGCVLRTAATSPTTVNKKAPIHNIIPINDTVHRPL